MNLPRFVPLLLPLIALASCQAVGVPSEQEMVTPIVFRAEVPEGTPGAVPYEDPPGSGRILWFGEAHPYRLQDAETTMGSSGRLAIFFEIVDGQQDSFADFTGSIVEQRMAIEIQGKIYAAPVVHSSLPGGGILDHGQDGFPEGEAEDLVRLLRTGS